ncbi:unnamed protein product [Paramecium primaurelia]|uniref:Uncharacterized protein n=1 Tax=Paramecium primaurelia TaxID=5886 RepID=A0A8S1K7U9_PARPR|nr:unnamed protein product [Paramecium primaurelia]
MQLSINIELLDGWTKHHFYRTSYQTMRNQDQILLKNSAIPGYSGHIPYTKSENIFGRPFSAITREAFNHVPINNEKWNTSTKVQFKNPKVLVSPTYRQTDKVLKNQKFRNSGYLQNNSTGDQKGWKTHKSIRGNNKVTEYRYAYDSKYEKKL